MKENIIQQNSFLFAIRIINIYKYSTNKKKEFVLSKQILRSGTLIGGQSDKDFLSKISISYKEARETIYWLKLLKETGYIKIDEFESIFNDAEEICKILGSIQIAIKKKKNN